MGTDRNPSTQIYDLVCQFFESEAEEQAEIVQEIIDWKVMQKVGSAINLEIGTKTNIDMFTLGAIELLRQIVVKCVDSE